MIGREARQGFDSDSFFAWSKVSPFSVSHLRLHCSLQQPPPRPGPVQASGGGTCLRRSLTLVVTLRRPNPSPASSRLWLEGSSGPSLSLALSPLSGEATWTLAAGCAAGTLGRRRRPRSGPPPGAGRRCLWPRGRPCRRRERGQSGSEVRARTWFYRTTHWISVIYKTNLQLFQVFL